jgi:hypothetical protein
VDRGLLCVVALGAIVLGFARPTWHRTRTAKNRQVNAGAGGPVLRTN